MRKLRIVLAPLLLLVVIIGALQCVVQEETVTTSSPTPTPTPTPILQTEIVLEADISTVLSPEEAITETVEILESRLDAYDVGGAVVEMQDTNLIVVKLPEVEDLDALATLITTRGMLDFREQTPTEEGEMEWVPAMATDSNGEEVHLTGKYLTRNTRVVIDQTTNEPKVAFEFNDEGANLFGQITGRLIGEPLGIFLDDQLVSSPTVRSRIEKNGVIENIALSDARELSILLNARAYPVPLELVSIRSLAPTPTSTSH